MMSKRSRRILRRPALLFWLTLLLCCAALAAGQWALERQRRRAEAIERDFQDQLDTVYHAVLPYRDRSMAQVAAGLNEGRPLIGQAGEEARPVPTLAGTVFDDRTALPPGVSPLAAAPSFRAELPGRVIGPRFNNWVIRLHFVNGTLNGAYATTPPHAVFTGPSRGWLTMQLALGGLVYMGAGFWCLSALLLPFNWPFRRQIAQAALAGLLVAALAQALGPGWSLPPLSFSAVRYSPLLTTMQAATLFSVIGLVMPARKARAKSGPLPCAHCGYDLTGNISGICPECGRYTPQGLIDRWRDQADRVAHIEDEESEQDESAEAVPVDEAEACPTAHAVDEKDQERPPALASWIPRSCVELGNSDQRPEHREPAVQAPVGVSML